jgi:hypothetical protein
VYLFSMVFLAPCVATVLGALIYAAGVRQSSRGLRVIGGSVALVSWPIVALVVWFTVIGD